MSYLIMYIYGEIEVIIGMIMEWNGMLAITMNIFGNVQTWIVNHMDMTNDNHTSIILQKGGINRGEKILVDYAISHFKKMWNKVWYPWMGVGR